MDEDDRHLLHEFMTGQKPKPRPNRMLNTALWMAMLGLFGTLLYLLFGK
ncbi:capsular polysaccharide biosynthesis protein [Bradyrhizobium sp. USDA 4341]